VFVAISESWVLSKAHEEPPRGSERKILRRIYAAVLINAVWRKRYNKELYNSFIDINIFK
jgi:hypothetical protein